MDKNDFLTKELKDISQVYSGKRDCCRCGCGGDYVCTSFMSKPHNHSVINDDLVTKRLNRAKRLLNDGAEYYSDDEGIFFDVQTGNNRTLTFYFDDLKKNIDPVVTPATIPEAGAAQIHIGLTNGVITVRHTNSKGKILFTKDAVKGDWDKIWEAIRNK